MGIHPLAIVSRHADLDKDVTVGPYATIGDHVKIGQYSEIGTHAAIEGRTEIGKRNIVYPFTTIGTPPQDLGYRGEDTALYLGNDNTIREYVTIHRATTKDEWKTVIGNDNYIMSYAHVAHDCLLGNGVVMANAATLGGHTVIGDHAYVGGLAATHQFVRIGTHAYIGGMTGIGKDIPPYMLTSGSRAKLYGINQIGLSRAGYAKETILILKKAYRIIWRKHPRLEEGIEEVKRELEMIPELKTLLNFLKGSKRGVLR